MKVALISIGDELLIGQTINTNAAWLGRGLSQRGFEIVESRAIRDNKAEISAAIKEAFSIAELVVITGGLGPTQDDITKDVLCEYFDTHLTMNEEVLERITSYFDMRGMEMLEMNKQQAMLPEKAKAMRNDFGTASGMWFEKDGKVLISLPGVPYEMKFIMEHSGFQMVMDHFNAQALFYKTIQVQGIVESFLAERIRDIEEHLRKDGLALAYLPQPGLIRLRLSASDTPEMRALIDEYIEKILKRIPVYAINSELRISEYLGNELRSQKATLSTVESCTGGALASEIVEISGASDYFMGSIVSYANRIKSDVVGVNEVDIEKLGAVSKAVVLQMAENGRRKLNTDYCLATSGIAGPEGGTEEKPVGTVWIAVAGPNGSWAKRFQFGNNRERNIRMTVLTALNLLRCELFGINIEKS